MVRERERKRERERERARKREMRATMIPSKCVYVRERERESPQDASRNSMRYGTAIEKGA
jgi:hypothetical protein